jgi:hypothetical protein
MSPGENIATPFYPRKVGIILRQGTELHKVLVTLSATSSWVD